MTQIEVAKEIIAQGGECHGVACGDCPPDLRSFCGRADLHFSGRKEWVQKWLAENEKIDVVNKPAHYTAGKYETKYIIEDAVEDFESYCHGNILKYVIRYRHKNGVEDLKKAQVYLGWLIERLSK